PDLALHGEPVALPRLHRDGDLAASLELQEVVEALFDLHLESARRYARGGQVADERHRDRAVGTHGGVGAKLLLAVDVDRDDIADAERELLVPRIGLVLVDAGSEARVATWW